jgi:hypothetical protein
MVALFKTGLEILEQGTDQRWEEDGGRRAEYLAIDKQLDATLRGLRSPVSLRAEHEQLRNWNQSQTLRRALVAELAIGRASSTQRSISLSRPRRCDPERSHMANPDPLT